MEGKEGDSSGVKLTGKEEAPSDHDIAPKSEAPNKGGSVPEATAGDIIGSPKAGDIIGTSTARDIIGSSKARDIVGTSTARDIIGTSTARDIVGTSKARDIVRTITARELIGSSKSAGSDETVAKKRRGRPRKEGSYGSPSATSSAPPFSRKVGVDVYGVGDSSSTSFTPHIISVNAGQDVAREVLAFAQQGLRAISILSGSGVVSNVTLRQPDSSGMDTTYNGPYEILSMSGSFIPTDNQGTTNMSGRMTISFPDRDGHVVGGRVTGVLLATTPVQVVVGSFLPNNQKDPKSKKAESDNAPANDTPAIAGSSAGSSAPPRANSLRINSSPPSPIHGLLPHWPPWATDPHLDTDVKRKSRGPHK